jgi:cellulose synthase operon protein YhjQ
VAQTAQIHSPNETEESRQQTLREAETATRNAAAERVEAARRAEAAAVAEAAARREERQIAEALASAQRQQSRRADQELAHQIPQPVPSLEEVLPNRYRRADEPSEPAGPDDRSPRRPQGYHPDDASGVRQIYRSTEPGNAQEENGPIKNARIERERRSIPSTRQEIAPEIEPMYSQRQSSVSYKVPPASPVNTGQRRTDQQLQTERRGIRQDASGARPPGSVAQPTPVSDPGFAARQEDLAERESPLPPQPVSTVSSRGRRAQDDFDYKQVRLDIAPHADSSRPPYVADPAGPAWLYAPPSQPVSPKPKPAPPPPVQPSVADTLQQSRERVASRWFALKGVFEQPGQELPEAAPVRQKETRTPVLAVFSLAGGVGKTSLVATVGRALSSLGEKVLLTDTTSHGLLPFYFGASELRPDTVRTFSPPSGSTDAPIYLVSHDVEQKGSDEAAQEQLVDEIVNNSRGTQRILLDLNANSSWIIRRMARTGPTVLVPLAPDMNSVISLQAVERYFQGTADGDGRPLQPFYVLNQFDSSLPLHLDVREVLRRQLGDRLLPFVIRRAPAVSEALAEGMTVVDYAPGAPVAEDYLNLATWLRTIAAPAAAGFRNVRWSER